MCSAFVGQAASARLGRIAYAVLSFVGFLGIGSKVDRNPVVGANHRFILDASKEQLEAAPGFDKDHWPTMADRTWATDIHAYYDVPPYWDGYNG
jgi:hypothetical protein